MNQWPAALLLLASLGKPLAAAPLTTAFTYQGQLKEGGAPAAGAYDFEFRLFDLAAGGAQQGSMIPKNDVLVENGLITVDLDFGPAFDGNRRWLDVRVRDGASAGAFTPLTPRQELSAAPYAIFALGGPGGSGPWQTAGANIFNTNPGNVGIGTTTPTSPLHLSGTAQIMEKMATSHTAGTWLELENTSTGGKRWGLISAGSANGEGAGKMLLRAITDGRTVMTLQGDGKVGVGVSNPATNLDVATNARVTSSSTAGGRLQLRGPASGLSFTLGAVDFVDANDVVHGSVSYRRSIVGDRLLLSTGQVERIAIDQNGNVGIGTTTPVDELHVRGDNATLRLEDDDSPNSFTLFEDAQPTQLRISKVNSSGSVFLDLNPKPSNGVSNGLVRLFRETNTTGAKRLDLFRGNNTTEASASIGVDGGDSFFQIHGGNVGIGTAAPAAKLDVNGSARVAGNLEADGNVFMGYEIVSREDRTGPDSSALFERCPPGKRVIGGGCICRGSNLHASWPVTDVAWECICDEVDSTVVVSVICANIR